MFCLFFLSGLWKQLLKSTHFTPRIGPYACFCVGFPLTCRARPLTVPPFFDKDDISSFVDRESFADFTSLSHTPCTGARVSVCFLLSGSNPDETADMRWKLAAQFEQEWPENTAEGCVEASKAQP